MGEDLNEAEKRFCGQRSRKKFKTCDRFPEMTGKRQNILLLKRRRITRLPSNPSFKENDKFLQVCQYKKYDNGLWK